MIKAAERTEKGSGSLGRRGRSVRRIQPPDFYRPTPKQSDFTDTELLVLRLWNDGKVHKGTQGILKLSSKRYRAIAESIYDKFGLTSKNGKRIPDRAVASAVVIGLTLPKSPQKCCVRVQRGSTSKDDLQHGKAKKGASRVSSGAEN